MRLQYENLNEENRLQSLKIFVSNIAENIQHLGENSLLAYRSAIENLLNRYGFAYVNLKGDRYDFLEGVNDFIPEITFAIDQEIAKLDPGWKHHLMSKKVLEMTGYEYSEYLKIIEY